MAVAPEPHIDPAVEPERRRLDDTTWLDLARQWVAGADAIYEALAETVPWQPGRIWRYERWVDEPRVSKYYERAETYPHPVLRDAHRYLERRYRAQFDGVALSWYRNGDDSVAFHRDREMRYLEDTVVAVLTFGARRPWLLRPRARRDKWIAAEGGATHDLRPGSGDLFVLGGRGQADWEHSVPKLPGVATSAGRISAQWRWTSRTGRPVQGASYRAPRNFSRR